MHAYPHCYRTEQPLLYMALSTWFMKVEQMRGRAGREQRAGPLGARARRRGALRQLARERARLEPEPQPLLGHAAPHLAQRRRPERHGLRRLHGRARGAGGLAGGLDQGSAPRDHRRHHLPLAQERQGAHAPHRRGVRLLVRVGQHALRAEPLSRSTRARSRTSSRTSRRTSSPRASIRRAAGSTRCTCCPRRCSGARRSRT